MFNQINPVPNLPEQEKNTIEYWKSIDVVEKLKELRKGRPEWVYYDGPITANNTPHYGHAIQWTMKDLIPRFWSMKNYFVSRNMGWDCQGIPVEFEVEKQLGFDKKEDIEKYGVEKFNNLCRESVLKYRDQIFYYETRIGRWFDETDMYYTMDSTFIESMWWSLKELYKKGYLYEGHKVVAYSTRAGTTLSQHEVDAGGYKEIEDPSITVKFPLVKDPTTSFLAWTTTPWTMPGNLMLAVRKDILYVKVKSQDQFYILAKDALERNFEGKVFEIVKEYKGADLVGEQYIPPYDYYLNKKQEGCFKVIESSHVGTEEGTGIVHLAPYGAEDFEILMSMGVKLFDYLDDTANFTKDIPEYEGIFYRDAADKINAGLTKKNLMFYQGKATHRMPMCWRTDTPLIYKPIKSWYIAVTKVKDKLLKELDTVMYVPEQVGVSMARTWVENARDWAISRKRYWGTPLPLWVNDKTDEKVFIGSFEELKNLSGIQLSDPHRPFCDEVTWEDKKKGGTFRRVKDVVDVWYDSGSMPFAQLHYPFENKEKLKTKFPAQYIVEAAEQTHLWFYTMLVLNVMLFDKTPYKNVVTHGLMCDEEGKRLSKHKHNYPPMDEVLDTLGGDVLRMFILTSPLVAAENVKFNTTLLTDIKKDFFLPLWNVLRYFLSYANEYKFEPSNKEPQSDNVLDKWILARLTHLINFVNEKFDCYLMMPASRELIPFVQDLSTWYLRRSRDRIKEGDLGALDTLYYVLVQFTKLIAPVTPFFSEEMYKALNLPSVTDLSSVHFDFYPKVKTLTPADKSLLEQMKSDREVVSKFLAERIANKLPVRQPLASVKTSQKIYFKDIVKNELNVKEILDESTEDLLDINITEDLKIEGMAREIIRKIQDLRKEQGLRISDDIQATYIEDEDTKKVVLKYGEDIKKKTICLKLEPSDKYSVKKV